MIERVCGAADSNSWASSEGGDLPSDKVDVVVTDGFTGNVALSRRRHRAHDPRPAGRSVPLFAAVADGRAAGLYPRQRLSKRIDPRRVNGGVFLGLNGTVVKSHGSADAHRASRRRSSWRRGSPRPGSAPGSPPGWQRPNRPPPPPSNRRPDRHDKLRAVPVGVGHYLPRAGGRRMPSSRRRSTPATTGSGSRSGIERRHFAAEGETTSQMAVRRRTARNPRHGRTGPRRHRRW